MASTSTTVVFPGAIYKVAKRVNPTVVIYGGATGTAGKITSNGGTDQAGTAVPYYAGVSGFSAVQGSTSLVDTVAYSFGWAASAEL
jgi:hypothetical protein